MQKLGHSGNPTSEELELQLVEMMRKVFGSGDEVNFGYLYLSSEMSHYPIGRIYSSGEWKIEDRWLKWGVEGSGWDNDQSRITHNKTKLEITSDSGKSALLELLISLRAKDMTRQQETLKKTAVDRERDRLERIRSVVNTPTRQIP